VAVLPPNFLDPYSPLFGSFLGGLPSYQSSNALLALLNERPTKRKTYFSFHFDDVWRVNVVRNAWKIDHPDSLHARSFYDSSLWEARQIEGDDAVKRLIREGVQNTSTICVLVGTETWLRRWVRYEIARAIVDKKGLTSVHINSIRDQFGSRQPLGHNPLSYMGICKVPGLADTWRYYLYEFKNCNWVPYQDYTLPVELPAYLPDPEPGFIQWLSAGVPIFDYVGGDGHKDIGGWIDRAAKSVGR
jgi:hypothetical protein